MTAPPLLSTGERPQQLGPVRFRLLVAASETGGTLSVAEFASEAGGPWTVPHVHRESEESFYVLDGQFVFTLGEEERAAGPGTFIWVPRGTRHLMRAEDGGGRLLTLWTPGGLEGLFLALAGLPGDSIRDPRIRAELAKRYDSIPV